MYILRYVYQIDMKFDRQLRPATETSWVDSYGGKTIPTWRTAAILKIDISPYNCEKSSDFVKFCTQQQILNCMNVTWSKMKKLHWTDSEFDRTYFLFSFYFFLYLIVCRSYAILELHARNDDYDDDVIRRQCNYYNCIVLQTKFL